MTRSRADLRKELGQRTLVLVDSGTTTTRVRLWTDGRITASRILHVGARDTARAGTPQPLRAALAEGVSHVLGASADGPPEAIVCSGMITSNVGLFEVPHLDAPAGLDDIAAAVTRRDHPEISDLPMLFIPGVRRLPVAGDIESLASADVLRGEEVECLGLTLLRDLTGPTAFLHFGSHHKAIEVDASARIAGSRTALTGELLAALREHTILRDGTSQLPRDGLDLEMARHGLNAARAHGFGRALFLVRVGAQLGGYDSRQMTSYLIGVLASTDLDLIHASSDSTIVLYGQASFASVLSDALATMTTAEVITVEDEELELATAYGSAAVYERYALGRGTR